MNIKRILNFIKQDITLAQRDNMAVYMIFAPLLLALVIKLFVPTVENVTYKFAVENGISQNMISQLEEYGDVEQFKSRQEVIKRINAVDDVPGIVKGDGKITIIFEGNEEENIIDIYETIIGNVTSDLEPVEVIDQSLGTSKSSLYEIFTIILIMVAIFMGGIIPGFSIVEEKETKAIRALNVSPMRVSEYIISRGILAVIFSIIIGIGTSLVMAGTTINYIYLVISILFSFGLCTTFTLVMGGLATNQISSITVIKTLNPLFLTIPIVSIFVPERLQIIFYPLPNYWIYQSLKSIYSSTFDYNFWMASTLNLILGTVVLLIFIPVFKKRLEIR